jgi:putative membrane protein
MISKMIPLLLTAGLMSTAGCDRDRDQNETVPATDTSAAAGTVDPTMPEPGTTDSTTAANADTATMDAGQGTPAERSALGVLNAINDHEIAAGRQALAKGVQGEVAAYAQMMIDQHTENRQKTSSFNPDASSAEANAQRSKGEQELATLDAKTGDAYARAYIDAMVKGHTEALAALDNQLIPAATRPEVRQHLDTTRGHVADHLQRAKELANATGNPG